jgi:hypothetical protein
MARSLDQEVGDPEMPSPFPGMNPYLEQDDAWHDFHERFLPLVADLLVAQVRPNYIVKIDEHVYVHEVPSEPRRFLGRAEVAVGRSPSPVEPRPGAALLEAPAHVGLPALDVERLAFVEVRDRRNHELVTVVELLSPSNRRLGSDRDQYLAKREQILGSTAHLVEIDLLRGGKPMPVVDRPEWDYSVLVSRVEQRPDAGFWPIHLRSRLPEVPVPLRAPDADARLDLQAILHRLYDAAGYEDYIYDSTPDPPLAPEDLAWARPLVP